MDLDKVTDQLNSMTVEELDHIIAAAKARKQFAKSGGEPAQTPIVFEAGTSPYDYVLAVICRVCKSYGTDLRGPAQAKRMQAYPTFAKAIPDVVAFLKTLTNKRAVELAVLRLVYQHMAEQGMGLALMLSNTSQVPRMLGEMFPGYYAAGLMPMAVGAVERSKQ